ncbi:hypothetical protein Y695_02031 [Hydrogenophaga sp. T4]|nr:hypothetical protein Y695_02031 [Hydrogenophaga sp. T4]
MAHILQLTHVAREVKSAQQFECRLGDALGFHAQLLGTLLQEEAREHGHVFTPLAQRGQAQADHIEAVEQVLAEHAFLDPLLQVLVRGGDHTHVGTHRAVAAHAVEMAVGEHAQQARLQVKRHVTDFVEKQRAAIGLLKAAAAHGLCTGEGPALVSEEFGLQQVFGDCRGVDRDKGARTRRVFVERARDQLLARARLAGDQHRHLALAQAPDGAEHVLHGGR